MSDFHKSTRSMTGNLTCDLCLDCVCESVRVMGLQMEHRPLPAGMQALQSRLREVTAPNAPQPLHWRYVIMAEAMQVLPPSAFLPEVMQAQ